MKDKAIIGDLAARIRRATARLERTVILKGARAAETGTFSGATCQWAIENAGERVMATVLRARRKLGNNWNSHAVIANAVLAASLEYMRARPLFLNQ